MSDSERKLEHERQMFEWNRRRHEETMKIQRRQAQARIGKDANDPRANFTLAQYYARGWGGLRRWPAKALYHCKIAAENKHPEACIEVAKFYIGVKSDLRDENSIPVNFREAKKYIELARECVDDSCLDKHKEDIRKDSEFCLGIISQLEEGIKVYEERFGATDQKTKKSLRCLIL